MWYTYYKKEDAASGPPERAEFVTLWIETRDVNGELLFFVHEKHGWWSEEQQQPLHMHSTLSTDGFASRADAIELLNRQADARITEGYIYSAEPDYTSSDAHAFVLNRVK